MTSIKHSKRFLGCLLAGICLGFPAGAGAKNCTLTFNAAPAAQTLLLSLVTLQHVQVGTVIQDCNGTYNYTLIVESANCPLSPAGAKLRDKVSREFVRYSVEFYNKTPGGGIVIVPGLLAQTCADQVARYETHIHGLRSSDVFIDFTGIAMLAAGIYNDTLSITLNIN